MKSLLTITLILISFLNSISQPLVGSDIYMADLSWSRGAAVIGQVENISLKKGYDNQASFSSDSKIIYYSSGLGLNTEIFNYNIEQESFAPLFITKGEDEYSPLETPDKKISFIRVEKDSSQRLWQFDPSNRKVTLISEKLDSVGYYNWIDKDNIIAYRITVPHSLGVFNLKTQTWTDLKKIPGRCFQKAGNQLYLNFFEGDDPISSIYKLKPDMTFELVAKSMNKTGDFAVTPEGEIFHGEAQLVYHYSKTKMKWIAIGETLVNAMKEITRMTVSPDGKKLVFTSLE